MKSRVRDGTLRGRPPLWSRRAAGVLVACLVATSCASEEDASDTEERGASLPVATDALSPTGSDLGNGYVVAEGSELIGAPIPAGTTVVMSGEPVKDDGWTAWLYVTGDPATVVDDYLAQAERRGLVPAGLPTGEVFEMEGEEVPPTGYARCGTVGDGGYECSAAASDDRGECLTLQLARTRRQSYLRLRLLLNDWGECTGVAGVASDPSIDPPPRPTGDLDAPAPGERFGDRWGLLARIQVQPGSAVVAGPLPGRIAVLSVDGDPEAVLASYLDEFRAALRFEPHLYREDYEVDGQHLLRRVLDEQAGGDLFTAELVVTSDEAAWLFLSSGSG